MFMPFKKDHENILKNVLVICKKCSWHLKSPHVSKYDHDSFKKNFPENVIFLREFRKVFTVPSIFLQHLKKVHTLKNVRKLLKAS